MTVTGMNQMPRSESDFFECVGAIIVLKVICLSLGAALL
jgi:hypothetical protein